MLPPTRSRALPPVPGLPSLLRPAPLRRGPESAVAEPLGAGGRGAGPALPGEEALHPRLPLQHPCALADPPSGETESAQIYEVAMYLHQ